MNGQRSRLPVYTANGNTLGYTTPLTNRRNSLQTSPSSPSNSMFNAYYYRDYYHHLPSPSHHIPPNHNKHHNLTLGPMSLFDGTNQPDTNSSNNYNQQHHHPYHHHHHHNYHSCHSQKNGCGGNRSVFSYRSAPSSALTSPRCSIPGTPNDINNGQFKLESPFIKSSASTPSRVVSRQATTPTSSSTKSRRSSTGLTKSTTLGSVLSNCSGKTGDKKFDSYMPLCEVQQALKKGEVIEGVLRINPKNFEDAYISAPDGLMDIFIGGIEDRNRAFNGDKVAVAINPPAKWKILYENLRVHWKDWGGEIEKCLQTTLALRGLDHSQGFWPSPEKKDQQLNGCSTETRFPSKSEFPPLGSHVFHPQSMQIFIPRADAKSSSQMKRLDYIHDLINDLKRFHCDVFYYNENSSVNVSGGSSHNQFEDSPPNNSSGKQKKTPKKSKVKEKRIPDGLPSFFSHLTAEDLIGCPHWEEFIQRTGQVKAIVSEVHTRCAGGKLKLMKEKNHDWALFCPTDPKIPRMLIPIDQCPPNFLHHSNHYENTMFIAQIESWEEDSKMPIGTLVKQLGSSGDIDTETEIILVENGIDDSEFNESHLIGLPVVEKSTDFIIPNKELLARRSFHDVCVFTIDPSTARDLDDAISIRDIEDRKGPNGQKLYEVGVHIADVTYFLKEGLPCDQEARKRTTSFYLVQKMIPMLPRVLCECLCSLNPGEDKLTFSVVWIMDEEGDTYDTWFGRSIIQSCVKLSYEIAQDMINQPEREWEKDELPPIYGKWSSRDVVRSVNLFMGIARHLRKKRLENGALNMREAKLAFVLDPETGIPVAFTPRVHLESHFLIEEFMLLANIAVTKKIYDTFPEIAFLRRHEPPDARMLKQFKEYCIANGLKDIDISSSKTIQRTLDSIKDPLVYTSLSNVLLRSLTQAKYFCAGAVPQSPNAFRHYALSVELYTHFTSPIRRYPDVIVHRMLAAALNCGKMVSDSPEELQELSGLCNIKKNASRLASAASGKLFVALYIRKCGIFCDEAVVVQILDHALDVMCIACNEFARVYCDKLDVERFKFEETVTGSKLMKLYWKGAGSKVHTIKPFSRLTVDISISPTDIHKWSVVAINPNAVSQQDDRDSPE